ncbi:MAG: type II toxin-antitoxin system HicB family antitoxin [Chlorobia bacterium]|nr:type II toxin-antitoxin system HicB family antitoxin [Fimbriimonadaceae bacterium]
MKYAVRLIPEDEGGFSVVVPGLPGCVSQGETRAEALDNVKEAILLYLEVSQESANEGEPESVSIDVKVA